MKDQARLRNMGSKFTILIPLNLSKYWDSICKFYILTNSSAL